MDGQQHLEALGDPDDVFDADSDFAGEHNDTAVDTGITEGRDGGEEESPQGWDGMDDDGTP